MHECQICQAVGPHPEYLARETMYGKDGEFTYFECSSCGCLQLDRVPDDLEQYYGRAYYSFGAPPRRGRLLQRLYAARDRFAFTGRGRLGAWLYQRYPKLEYRFLSRLALSSGDRVLDVGCGSGALLHAMRRAGFHRLTGIDPFIEQDLRYSNGITVFKRSLPEFAEPQDLVMFNHSLEHMPHQQETLRHAASLISEHGVVVVRVPIVSSFAWRHYRTDWVQLDAPRHIFLHSIKSMEVLAARAGLELYETFFDSDALQFWGSEQCRRGVPLASSRSRAMSKRDSGFTSEQIASFEAQARELNATAQGDQAAFFMRRKVRHE
jgi:SAM-dependent methyltransferase